MTTKDLIPLKKGSERAKILGRKGGLSKSLRKQTQSRLTGLLSSKKLSSDMRHILTSMRDRNYSEVLNELISFDVQNVEDDDARRKAIDQLQKFMPTKVMTVNTNINIDVEQDNKDAKAHLKKLFG